MHGMYVKEKLYVYKCIKMHGIYVKGTLYIFINYQYARYICEGNTIYIYKYINMHVMYVKGKLCVSIYIYIYVCVSRCTVYMRREHYVYI